MTRAIVTYLNVALAVALAVTTVALIIIILTADGSWWLVGWTVAIASVAVLNTAAAAALIRRAD